MSASTRRGEGQLPFPDDGDACGGRGGNGAEHPGEVADHVEDHHKVVHIVVVGGGDVDQPPQESVRTMPAPKTSVASAGLDGWWRKYWRKTSAKRGPAVSAMSSWKMFALGVPVADAAPISWVEWKGMDSRCRDGGEGFVGIVRDVVLDDLDVVEGAGEGEGGEEGGAGEDGVQADDDGGVHG